MKGTKPNTLPPSPDEQGSPPRPKLGLFQNLQYDLPAGVVVFLVAIPLCLGIALASKGTEAEAPLFSGLLAGILGGLVVPLISRSALSVSGPAAGLIAIVITGLDTLGSWEAFLVAVMLGGVLQIILGLLKVGTIAYFFPSSVIRGMLAAIGLILIRKQLPHALGIDSEAVDLNFHLRETLDLLGTGFSQMEYGAFIISLVSLGILVFWGRNKFLKDFHYLPGALVVVIVAVIINTIFVQTGSSLALMGGMEGHLVNLPDALVEDGIKGFAQQFTFPDWSALGNVAVYTTALAIGLVASVESLLSVEAVDKLDPHKRQSPLNRELLAQGVANTLAGLLGALPITAVIVRSSANVNSGGQTRMSAFFHGLLLLVSVITIGGVLNLIPLASLAAILLLVGYKLAHPSLFRRLYQRGMNQFIPFVTTIVAVLVFDLLIGIAVGTAVGIFFTIRANFHLSILTNYDKASHTFTITLNKDVSFLNKAALSTAIEEIPDDVGRVVVDGSGAEFIDKDIQEILFEYQIFAEENGIDLTMIDVGKIEPGMDH